MKIVYHPLTQQYGIIISEIEAQADPRWIQLIREYEGVLVASRGSVARFPCPPIEHKTGDLSREIEGEIVSGVENNS